MTFLAMTKLVVADLDRARAFYEDVCGFRVRDRVEVADGGRRIVELIMDPAAPGGATLVLYHAADVPVAPGSTVLVFDTDDVDGFVARALAAGATLDQPVRTIAALGVSFAFLRDPDGHILEPLRRG